MDKEEAIKRFEQMVEDDGELGCLLVSKDIEALNMAISALKGGWIPIKEREPDSAKVVFLSLQSFEVVKGWKSRMLLNGEQCYYDCNAEDYIASNNVLAWQPLPEPYTESEITE